MSGHCHDCHLGAAEARDPRWRRILWIALVVNAAMFFIEVAAGLSAESASLLADAVDFAGDALNYAASLLVLGMAAVWSTRLAALKGAVMLGYGLVVLARAAWLAWAGSSPEAFTMGGIGLLAFAANLAVALLLYRYRGGSANAQSVWLCSRNDALGNLAIVLAALGVFGTGTAWPDLIVAAFMAVLGISGGWQVLRRVREERAAAAAHAHG
ncbi:MAG TPA: cation transporter [Burkholderiaceae bacterium]|nr:cation transporter [Burkholderiaceae bacterium]